MANYSAFRKRKDSRVTLSSSTNALSFSSACTIKRFPSSRCASATKIVCPLELIVETQPQLNPAFLRLSAILSQYFTRRILPLLHSTRQRQNAGNASAKIILGKFANHSAVSAGKINHQQRSLPPLRFTP